LFTKFFIIFTAPLGGFLNAKIDFIFILPK